MSVVIVITPILASAAWPLVAAAAVTALASMGYRESTVDNTAECQNSVEIGLDNNQELQGAMGRGEVKTFTKDDIRAILRRDGRGSFTLQVEGPGYSQTELEEKGQQLVNSIVQQYAYSRVVGEMSNRGYNKVEENVSEDGSIHLTLRRWQG